MENVSNFVLLFSALGCLLQHFQTSFQTFGNIHNVFDAICNFIESCTNTVDVLFKNRNITEVRINLCMVFR